tara:strand:+ start:5109 stop:5591 length:483 start_codon:yes stop_codon:yes gene_type:complete
MNPLLQSVQLALQSVEQEEALKQVDKAVKFCIKHENGKVFDGWDEDLIRLMVAYHWAKKTLIVHKNEDKTIRGVFMWYNCDKSDGWNFVNNWEPDKEDGDSIFMAFLFADGKDSFKELTKDFINKCPEALTKNKIGLRYRNGFPKRILYTNKLFKKIINQ